MKCKKGYKLKGEKCVKRHGLFSGSSSKKSYNPLKMYGSYIGLVLGGVYGYLALKNYWFDFFDILIKLGMKNNVIGSGIINYPVAIISQAIIGFLVGWGIHSLIRRFRHGY